jgi:drug/metabolite transporter (DMT)-like permease
MTSKATLLRVSFRLKMILAFVSIYTIWGSTYLGIKFAIQTIPPFLMAGTRFIIAGLMLYLWTWSRGVHRPSITNWKAASIIGGSLLLGGNGGVVWAEYHEVPSSLVAILITTVPLWMALLEWLRNDRVRPTAHVALGLLIGFSGVVILVGPQQLIGSNIDRFAALVVVLASLSWAAGSLYSRRAQLSPSPLQSIGMEMFTGGVLLSAAGLLTGELASFDAQRLSATSLMAYLYLIIFGSIVGFTAYIWLLTKTTSAKVSTYAYVNPIIAVLLGWAFAGEQLTWQILLAAGVIISAVVLINSTHLRQEKKGAGRLARMLSET